MDKFSALSKACVVAEQTEQAVQTAEQTEQAVQILFVLFPKVFLI